MLILCNGELLKTFENHISDHGGGGYLTMNLPVMIFRTAMNNSNYGYANAIAFATILVEQQQCGDYKKYFTHRKD